VATDVYIVQVDGLNLRQGPGTDQPIQTVAPGAPTSGQPIQLDAGQGFWVIDRSEVDGQTWYQIVTEVGFLPGCVSTGPGDAWVMPFDQAACPASANEAAADGFLRDKPMQALACFGSVDVVIVVYWPTPEETGVESPCPWGQPQWVLCYEYVNLTEDGTRSIAVYGTTELPDFQRGRWVAVTGHYDDPRSPDCAIPSDADQAAASVLFCRTRFVADSVEPSPP
jgi:hypothetical protein